jgi:hypothetical protein
MSPERLPAAAEASPEVSNAAAEQLEKLRDRAEKAGEQLDNSGERADAARKDAAEVFGKDKGTERKAPADSAGPVAPRITKAERAASYRQTMRRVQAEMTPVQRQFSKVIHAPVIERTSEVVGSTFARPTAILAGSSTALVLVTAVYIIARTFGYPLSGFETIGAFTFGWILGLTFDFVKVMVTGKR